MIMDLNIPMNKSNLTYLLDAWMRIYLQERNSVELSIRAAKILDALRMKVDGKRILSQYSIDNLEEAFLLYQKAKLKLDQETDEFMDVEDYDDYLRGYKQGVKREYFHAISSLNLD
jgi:hypothetical protein